MQKLQTDKYLLGNYCVRTKMCRPPDSTNYEKHLNMGVDIHLDIDVDPSTLEQDGKWTTAVVLVLELAGTRRDV